MKVILRSLLAFASLFFSRDTFVQDGLYDSDPRPEPLRPSVTTPTAGTWKVDLGSRSYALRTWQHIHRRWQQSQHFGRHLLRLGNSFSFAGSQRPLRHHSTTGVLAT